jgi:plasmid stability protein
VKNMTITVDEDVASWARVWAARHDTSVSRLVGEILRERMLEEERYEVAMRQYLDRAPVRLKRAGGYPDRESLHDRRSVR